MIRLCAFADEAASSLDGQIEVLHACGIRLLELRFIDGKGVASITEEEARDIRQRLDREGIRVFSIGSPLGKIDIRQVTDAYMDEVRHVCRLAVVFGCSRIRAFSFYGTDGLRECEREERVVSFMEQMAAVAREYGIYLCHENEKDIYGDSAARVLALSRRLHDWRFVFDPANYVQVGDRADAAFSLLSPITDYYHIKDVIKDTGEHVPAGMGDGQIEHLIRTLQRDVVLTLEPHLAEFDAYADIDRTVLKTKFRFDSRRDAFVTAAAALKNILKSSGYTETEGETGTWKQA